MLPHCAAHMLRTISLHFFRAPLNGTRFWDGLIVFQTAFGTLHHIQASNKHCGMPPWTSQPFGVTCVLKNCEPHDLAFPFLTRATRSLWGTESHARRVFLGKASGIREPERKHRQKTHRQKTETRKQKTQRETQTEVLRNTTKYYTILFHTTQHHTLRLCTTRSTTQPSTSEPGIEPRTSCFQG